MPRNVSRRSVLAAGGAAVTLGTVAAPAAATTLPDADAPLFDLCRRWREMEPVIAQLSDEYDELHWQLPSREWTPEELTAHRIDGKRDKPRFVSLEDLEKNARWDSPQYPTREFSDRDDGVTLVQTITTVRRTATEEELEAWRGRCAARRALYDAKEAARKEAFRASGAEAADRRLDAAYRERDGLSEEIKAYRPTTMAGALEKMRVYREIETERFDADPDELDWTAILFLSALGDLERLAGTAI